MQNLTYSETLMVAKKIFEGAGNGLNVGMEACLLNLRGDENALKKLEATGFKQLVKASLPEYQHTIGWVSK